jgi:hypothetical protein
MRLIDSLVERLAKLCKKILELGTQNTVEIDVRGIKVRATVTGETKGKFHRVNYDDPNGYPVQKWITLTPEQIAELQEPLELTHKF